MIPDPCILRTRTSLDAITDRVRSFNRSGATGGIAEVRGVCSDPDTGPFERSGGSGPFDIILLVGCFC